MMFLINFFFILMLVLINQINTFSIDLSKEPIKNDQCLNKYPSNIFEDKYKNKPYSNNEIKLPQHSSKKANNLKLYSEAGPEIFELIRRVMKRQNNQTKTIKKKYTESAQGYYSKCFINNDKSFKYTNSMFLYFDLQSLLKDEFLVSIEKSKLRLYYKPIDNLKKCDCKSNLNENMFYLSLFEIKTASSNLIEKENSKNIIETKKFNKCCIQSLVFNLTNVSNQWINNINSNHGFILELVNDLGDKMIIDELIKPMNCSDKSAPLPFSEYEYVDIINELKITEKNYPKLDLVYFVKEDIYSRYWFYKTIK